MKKILFLLLPVYCFGQTFTSIDPATKDTTVIEVKGVSVITKVPMITYKDSSYTYYGTTVTVKKYKPTETSTGTTTAFTGQIIPYSDADLIAPGRGAEHWGGHIWDDVDAVKVPAGVTQGLDYYYRFNWRDSNNYLSALEALNKAIANHINTTSYNGKLYKHAVGYIDVRGYGNFGEWHNWPYSGSTPTGRTATIATLLTYGKLKYCTRNNI